ncbi:glycosyltransferase family 2 protein [Acetobacter sacchari]|uniref:Glycosyltransferase family 2 protein n=1 Tax=Acetobacter sacchari TaxID=2661687 RepID=A0ABS3LWM4_9PROT|nr:glycosyltransferase family 2 protein [Acetobacter sacchari]MBO1360328.1 glycosyltransferase family 2 protein [Acetobacter sacchari]
MSFSLIVVAVSRPEYVETIEKTMAIAARYLSEIIIVHDNNDIFTAFKDKIRSESLNVLGIYSGDKQFNKSFFINIAASYARKDVLLFCDSDVYLTDFDFEFVANNVVKKNFFTLEIVSESVIPENFVPYGNLHRIDHGIKICCSNGIEVYTTISSSFPQIRARGAPGIFSILKENFTAVGGYNSALEGWGWEDIDFILRSQLTLGLRRLCHGRGIHLTHGDAQRNILAKNKFEDQYRNRSKSLNNISNDVFIGTMETDFNSFTR